MLVRSKIIYEDVAKKHDLPIELIESVGNCVFEELRAKLNEPTDLAYELPKFGVFNLRFSTFERYYENFQKQLDEGLPEAIAKRDSNLDFYKRTTLIYNKIKAFRSKKAEIKIQRNGEGEDNA